MDNRNGEFEFLEASDFSEHQENIFKVGEIVEVKASRFRIQKITKKNIVLKLLKPKTD
jgi:uncharacterized Zn finger protein